jgi:hypothetical protein
MIGRSTRAAAAALAGLARVAGRRGRVRAAVRRGRSGDRKEGAGGDARADARRAGSAVREYVSRIGHRLAAAARGPAFDYTFDVANYRDLNALTLPGGHIWLYRGALVAAASESEAAGVLAHEVAHVELRHAARQISYAVMANMGLELLGALLGNTGGATTSRAAAGALTSGAFLSFSRDDEREADREGTRILARAGWDPRGLLMFLQIARTAARSEGRRGGRVLLDASVLRQPRRQPARRSGGAATGPRRRSRLRAPQAPAVPAPRPRGARRARNRARLVQAPEPRGAAHPARVAVLWRHDPRDDGIREDELRQPRGGPRRRDAGRSTSRRRGRSRRDRGR